MLVPCNNKQITVKQLCSGLQKATTNKTSFGKIYYLKSRVWRQNIPSFHFSAQKTEPTQCPRACVVHALRVHMYAQACTQKPEQVSFSRAFLKTGAGICESSVSSQDPPVSAPKTPGYLYAQSCCVFTWVPEIQTQVLTLHGNHSLTEPSPQTPKATTAF